MSQQNSTSLFLLTWFGTIAPNNQAFQTVIYLLNHSEGQKLISQAGFIPLGLFVELLMSIFLFGQKLLYSYPLLSFCFELLLIYDRLFYRTNKSSKRAATD